MSQTRASSLCSDSLEVMTDVELHRLDRRYEGLRRTSPDAEKRTLASLARVGQLAPVIVVADSDRFTLIDGYKRVRALSRLRADLVSATVWDLSESDALVLERMMRIGATSSAIEDGWLLRELRDRFGLSGDELSHRFDRSASWVSGRLGLVSDVPEAIQAQVRDGDITAHAAMRYLVPFARANEADCLAFAQSIGRCRPSTRETQILYLAYRAATSEKEKSQILADPRLVLRAREEAGKLDPTPRPLTELIVEDLDAMGGVARRAFSRLRNMPTGEETSSLRPCLRQTRCDVERLFARLEKELNDARPRNTHGDLEAPRGGPGNEEDSQSSEDLTRSGQRGDRVQGSASADNRACGESEPAS